VIYNVTRAWRPVGCLPSEIIV